MRSVSLRPSSLMLALCLSLCANTWAQQPAPAAWTEQEVQFVKNARALYEQQGLAYTDEQAQAAVEQMRAKARATPATPALKGIPESQWSTQERAFAEELRAQYRAQNRDLGQEEAQIAVQSMREQMARIMGGVAAMRAAPAMAAAANPMPTATASQAASAGSLTESQLAATLASWPTKSSGFILTERPDGFEVNGEPVIDPEGKITAVASDAVTGAITYAVETGNHISIKAINPARLQTTLTIASGNKTPGGWEITTATGKRLSGKTISLLSDGFLVARESAGFQYRTGRGISNIAVPKGWSLTPWQRGDVASTGYVLIEKNGAQGTDSASSLLSSLQTVASLVGASRKEDYALFNPETKKTIPLNIAANLKNVNVHSQCRRKNALVNECARMDSFESLYQTDGRKNVNHYYWSIRWLNTPAGPIALTLEDGQRKLYVTDMKSGKRATVLERGLGINDWELLPHADGSVGVKGKLGFEMQEVPDVMVAFTKPQEAPTRDEVNTPPSQQNGAFIN